METNRREMLRGLFNRATEVAQELAPLRAALEPMDASSELQPPPPSTRAVETVPATAGCRLASQDELDALAVSLGLAPHLEAIHALSLYSVRLLPDRRQRAVHRGGSRFGAGPASLSTSRQPDDESGPGPCLVQLNLSQITTALRSATPLPTSGFLRLRGGLASASPEPSLAAVSFEPDDIRPGGVDPRSRAPDGQQEMIRLSTELTLPRAWSAHVQDLDLGPMEIDAWQRLRRSLAELQGLAPIETLSGQVAIHRLLGYSDESTGSMPLACAMVSAGIELNGEPPYADPRAPQLASEALRWRLLLQLSRDDQLGWSFGERRERLYVWIHEEDLAAAKFERARAITR